MKVNGLPIYKGDARPVNLYCGRYKISGWRWDEQSGLDMPFEHTYNDNIDIVAQGRSKQAVTVQGKNLAFNSGWLGNTDGWVLNSGVTRDPTRTLNGNMSVKSDQSGHAGDVYRGAALSINNRVPCTAGETLSASVWMYVEDHTLFDSTVYLELNLYDSNNVRLTMPGTGFKPTSAHDNKWTRMTRTIVIPSDPPGITNCRIFPFVQRNGCAWFACPQIERGSVTDYAPFTPDSPSPAYPSPIISAEGGARVEGRNLFDYEAATGRAVYGITSIIPNGWRNTISQVHSSARIQLGIPNTLIQGKLYRFTPRTNGHTSIRVFSAASPTELITSISTTGHFTPPDTPYICLLVYRANAPIGSVIDVWDVLVEQVESTGSPSHPYTPYRPIIAHDFPVLRGIPDGSGGWAARDTLEVVGGRWRLTQWVGRISMHDVVYTIASGQPSNTALVRAHMIVSSYLSASPVLCTHLPYAGTAQNVEGMQSHTAAPTMSLTKARVTGWSDAWTNAEKTSAIRQYFHALHNAGDTAYLDYVLATPIIHDLGPADLPSYYPYTRVLIDGEYPPEVVARCRVGDV